MQFCAVRATKPQLNVRSPRPIGSTAFLEFPSIPVICFPICGGCITGDYFDETVIREELLVDGAFVKEGSPFITHQDQLAQIIESLEEGEHELEIRRTVRIDIDGFYRSPEFGKIDPPHMPCTVSVSGHQRVVISGSDYDQLLQAQFNVESLDEIQSGERFKDLGSGWSWRDFLERRNFTSVIAGHMRLRAITSDHPQDPCESQFRIPHDICNIEESLGNCASESAKFNVTFVPSPELAFDAGFDEYFNGVVEWHNAEIRDGIPVLGVPDSVRRYDPAEFDVVASAGGG